MHAGGICRHCYRPHYPWWLTQYAINVKPAWNKATWYLVPRKRHNPAKRINTFSRGKLGALHVRPDLAPAFINTNLLYSSTQCTHNPVSNGSKTCKNVEDNTGVHRGCLSEARCRLAHGPADGTATHSLLLLGWAICKAAPCFRQSTTSAPQEHVGCWELLCLCFPDNVGVEERKVFCQK